jgi:cystathionine beta-lyase/cystathionine gamma-synthase
LLQLHLTIFSEEGKRMSSSNQSFSTKLQHAGHGHRVGKGLVGAVETSVTFRADAVDGKAVYARLSNTQNHKEVEELLAQLHGASRALVFGSGMAAMSAFCMHHLKPGDHILAQENCYGGNQWLFGEVLRKWGVEVTYAPLSQWQHLVKQNTKLLYCETIGNPMCQPQRIDLAAQVADKTKIPLLVDNTFASPVLFRPLDWGASYVIESGTKYLNGHSDVVCGALFGPSATLEAISKTALCLGGFLSTQGCAQLLRGLRTLELRVQRQNQSAAKLAEMFRVWPLVSELSYGVGSDAQLGKLFSQGCGGMMAVRFSESAGISDRIEKLGFVQYVPSLAGTETTVTMPWFTTNAYNSEEALRRPFQSEVTQKNQIRMRGVFLFFLRILHRKTKSHAGGCDKTFPSGRSCRH